MSDDGKSRPDILMLGLLFKVIMRIPSHPMVSNLNFSGTKTTSTIVLGFQLASYINA